jgi:hypothetical protein
MISLLIGKDGDAVGTQHNAREQAHLTTMAHGLAIGAAVTFFS